ncbi:winged helix-turn-helix DNA-binding protein [Arthrobacter sp. SLBN-100]|uniref:winged helix-turn-helix domain-containing protein n=1 Tax=Arthrobacter sp. SLBN-100 TaxID=2768450 RepID=UPI00115167A0|nr:winged helix-turn-helix domain-containing protein [Arthrobacter sp. SLBN-100]TQJ70099.1 winged helix-turn-helix DNA-binding protein [Arthrobacter sp. SLBN-100]
MTVKGSSDSGEEAPRPGGPARPAWTFLTNHGHVLLSVARDPDILVTDIAERVGITTRAALQILKDLETAGYLQRAKVGRRTRYTIQPHQHFRHPTTAAQEVDGLIRLFSGRPAPGDGQGRSADR